jgi:hypothetical protein
MHKGCKGIQCRLNCINNIHMHLNTYSEALLTVTFKKENMRHKCSWLSAFYSLIIQSMVRSGLLELSEIFPFARFGARQSKSIEQYMHIGLRLFIASSGIHDPLMRDYSAIPISSGAEEKANGNYQAARKATRQESWGLRGIKSSADFLRTIFEDEGGPLEEPPKTSTDPRTTLLESNDHTLRNPDEYDDDSNSHDNP